MLPLQCLIYEIPLLCTMWTCAPHASNRTCMHTLEIVYSVYNEDRIKGAIHSKQSKSIPSLKSGDHVEVIGLFWSVLIPLSQISQISFAQFARIVAAFIITTERKFHFLQIRRNVWLRNIRRVRGCNSWQNFSLCRPFLNDDTNVEAISAPQIAFFVCFSWRLYVVHSYRQSNIVLVYTSFLFFFFHCQIPAYEMNCFFVIVVDAVCQRASAYKIFRKNIRIFKNVHYLPIHSSTNKDRQRGSLAETVHPYSYKIGLRMQDY